MTARWGVKNSLRKGVIDEEGNEKRLCLGSPRGLCPGAGRLLAAAKSTMISAQMYMEQAKASADRAAASVVKAEAAAQDAKVPVPRASAAANKAEAAAARAEDAAEKCCAMVKPYKGQRRLNSTRKPSNAHRPKKAKKASNSSVVIWGLYPGFKEEGVDWASSPPHLLSFWGWSGDPDFPASPAPAGRAPSRDRLGCRSGSGSKQSIAFPGRLRTCAEREWPQVGRCAGTARNVLSDRAGSRRSAVPVSPE